MKLAPFDYASPSTIAEAIKLLAENDGAKIMSGGQSLMPLLAFRLAAPSLIVDLKNIPGLDRIDIGVETLRLGARVRWVDIERDVRLKAAHPLLARAIEHVAHYQIRNRGTVGGSVAHADPAAEMPGIAVTCDAVMEIVGGDGERRVDAAEFFLGWLQTALRNDEVLVAVHLPAWKPGRKWAFEEFARRRGDFALAGVLLHYDEDRDGRIADAHVGAIGIGHRPHRIPAVEDVLNGHIFDDLLVTAAVDAAAEAVEPSDDLHAGADYRKALYCTLLERALRRSRA